MVVTTWAASSWQSPRLLSGFTSSDFTATIWSATDATPPLIDTQLHTLSNPSPFAVGTPAFSAPANTVLEKDTTYFVHLSYTGTGRVIIKRTNSHAEDSGGAAGWSIGNLRYYQRTGTVEPVLSSTSIFQFAVTESAVGGTATPALSSDANLSALALSGVDALAPPFRWDFTGYRATVDNPVSSIVVTATPNHTGASAEVLVDNLPADSNGRVSLGLGDNTVKVVVTAEDGAATKIYQVIVHRRYPAGRAGPHIVVAASKQVSDRRGGPDNDGYRERDLIIAMYNLESDATWSGDNYSGDFSTLDYVHRTDILGAGGTTSLADLERRNECEGPALFERNHIQMSVDRQIRKVNENPETRGGGVIDVGDCVNAFKVTVTVWTGADYIPEGSEGRYEAPYAAQLTCQFDGLDSTHDDFTEFEWGGKHTGPGWYYHEYVLCTDANGDLAPDSAPTIPALNWERPEED